MTEAVVSTQSVIEQYRQSENDTGSSEVQVALLTHKIKHLTMHLKANPKDKHSRRGLTHMVNKRRKLLAYLKANQYDRYIALIKSLGLRH